MTDTFRLELESNVTIAVAGDLYNQLHDALDSSRVIEVNAEAVEKIDTAGLQLLCLVSKELQSHFMEIKWFKPSQAFLASAKLLGVAEILKC